MLSAIRSDASGCAGGYSTLFFADDTPENIDSTQRLLDGRVRTILVDVGCAISFFICPHALLAFIPAFGAARMRSSVGYSASTNASAEHGALRRARCTPDATAKRATPTLIASGGSSGKTYAPTSATVTVLRARPLRSAQGKREGGLCP